MLAFAVDPGNIQSAYCVMDDNFFLLEFGKYENKKVMDILLGWLPKIDVVVIERMQSFGMPVGKEVFEACEWIGRFSQEAEKSAAVRYIYRKEEKLYLCGNPRAKDVNIRAALIERFAKHDFKNGRGTKANPDVFYGVKADIWSAIAIATTHYDILKEGEMKNV